MTLDLRRVAVVAAALAGVGAVVGGVLGAVLVSMLTMSLDRMALPVGAQFGAMVGFVLAPIAAFTLMRRVPIWRAIAETAAGTLIGAGAGFVLMPIYHQFIFSEISLGIAGFALAALRLRFSGRGMATRASTAATSRIPRPSR
ncbi:MAG: hypothetical protein ABIY52_06000 [Gemmatimonadaceae bacterium]